MKPQLDWIFTTKEMSLDDKAGRIRKAVTDSLNPTPVNYFSIPAGPDQMNAYWVREIYPTYAIACKDGEHFKVNYHWEWDEVKIDSGPIPVEMAWIEKVVPNAV
jgi:hypothetical protein